MEGGKTMTEIEKRTFLFFYFCQNAYEQYEMNQWINQKGIDYVFQFIQNYFSDSFSNRNRKK